MPDVRIHKASEMKPRTRAALEETLGRALKNTEEVSIIAFEPHPAPGTAKAQAVRALAEHFKQIDEKTKDIPEHEMDEVIDEALRAVRPRYREHK